MLQQDDIDALRGKGVEPRNLLIDGRFKPAISEETLSITSPIDGTELTTIASAGQTDIEIVCVIDPVSNRTECAGRPLVSSFKKARELAGDGLDFVLDTA